MCCKCRHWRALRGNCDQGINAAELVATVGARSPALELLEALEDALDMLDDSLVSIAVLLDAHHTVRPVPPATLKRVEQQCTAAAVGVKKLRARLVHLKAVK